MAHIPTIGVVMIVKDEEAVLDRCLSSVGWCDEVVVYDTGSSDGTLDVARRHSDKVVVGSWDDDFGGARNRALAHSTTDWVLSIDADEVFEGSPATVRAQLAGPSTGVWALTIYSETGNPLQPAVESTGPRVFRRADHRWRNRLHEQVCDLSGVVSTATLMTGVNLRHHGYVAEVVAERSKGDRNVAVIEAELADARRRAAPEDVAVALVHLARSLVFAGRLAEAWSVADQAWAGRPPTRSAGQLAGTMADLAIGVADLELAETWIRRWQDVEPGEPGSVVASARVLLARGEAAAAADLLEQLPSVAVTASGTRFARLDHAALHVRALAAAGLGSQARRAARRALEKGARDFAPVELYELFGEVDVRAMLALLSDRQWRDWGLRCAQLPVPASLSVLELMAHRRSDNLTVLLCAARLHPVMTLETAGLWSRRLRKLGLNDECTLLALAGDDRRLPRDRALAAALVYGVYREDRALPLLESALALVARDQEDEVLRELQIVAPGLVSVSG